MVNKMNNYIKKGMLAFVSSALLITGCQNKEINNPNYEDVLAKNAEYKAVYNNYSDFVQYGNLVYFFSSDGEYMDKPVALGDFRQNDVDLTNLMQYDLDSKNLNYVNDTIGYGKISITSGYMFYEDKELVGDNYNSVLRVMNLETKSIESIYGEELLGGDENGAYVVTLKKENDVNSICVYHGHNVMCKKSVETYVEFAGIDGDGVYLRTNNNGGTDMFLSYINIVSGEVLNLGQFPNDPDGGTIPKIDQFMSDDQNVYLGYGFYNSNGDYVKGYYLKTEKGKEEKTLSPTILKSAKGAKKTPTFYVKKTKMKKADGVPYTADIDDAGNMGYYNSKGSFVTVKSGYCDKDIVDATNVIEEVYYVNGKLFFIKDLRERVEEADEGWKDAYKLNEQYIEYLDENNLEKSIHCIIDFGDTEDTDN